MKDSKLALERAQIEHKQDWREWAEEIPFLKFDPRWDIKIIPPFGGAMARFWLEHKKVNLSVYLDVNSELGYMWDHKMDKPLPYWEVYDGEDCTRFLMDETTKLMDHINSYLK